MIKMISKIIPKKEIISKDRITTKYLTKYEKTRLLGTRALQISMNAKSTLENINETDSLKIAEMEFESGILPISIKRPLPDKRKEKLKREKEKELSDEKIKELEEKEQKEIAKEGEIMELAKPEDEQETSTNPGVGQ